MKVRTTRNALSLDPTRDLIVDHVNGLEDIDARVIRTIGDPVVRFREDPVRILRAAKFAGRLGFTVEKDTLAAMAETAEDLVRAAPPRVLEEILRLLRSGHAHSSFELLRDVGAIQYLVPVVGKFLKNASDAQSQTFWSLLDALDQRLQSRPSDLEPPPNGVLLAVLMYGAVQAEREQQPTRSASSVAESLLGSLAVDLRLPRRERVVLDAREVAIDAPRVVAQAQLLVERARDFVRSWHPPRPGQTRPASCEQIGWSEVRPGKWVNRLGEKRCAFTPALPRKTMESELSRSFEKKTPQATKGDRIQSVFRATGHG